MALAAVVRLIWRACSRTLDFASTIEAPVMAVVERQRTKAAVFFWFACTRIRAAGRAMVVF